MLKTTSRILSLTHCPKFTYIPPSCYDIKSKVNPIINVTLGNDNSDFCNIQFRVIYSLWQLFENVVPKTSENFRRLLLGKANYQGRVLSLLNTFVNDFVPKAYIQLGNLPDGNCSIFGPTFRD